MKALKSIAKAALTIALIVASVLVFAEASTALGQVILSGSALLTIFGSYKGLEALGTFNNIK